MNLKTALICFTLVFAFLFGIICGVAFARSSLRRIGPYASVVTPRRLASDALLVIRSPSKPPSELCCGN